MAAQIRILHVVGSMNVGGAETWLLEILRRNDGRRFQMDFLLHSWKEGTYDAEVEELGGHLVRCRYPRIAPLYAREFVRVLRRHGPYDIVHSHCHHYSGWVLWLAARAGVRARIAHSHNDTSRERRRWKPTRRIYRAMTEQLIRKYATAGLAVSRAAARDLFGPNWQDDNRWRLLECGINLEPFERVVSRVEVRAEFGIPEDALVVGHVGRFVEQKNHAWLLRVFAEVRRASKKAVLLLVGDGPLRRCIEGEAARHGLAGGVIFAGLRRDVARLMLGAMDVFVFPSVYEGLGLAVLEAQAAGLPSVVSTSVPCEANVVPALVKRLSLECSEASWAEAVLEMSGVQKVTGFQTGVGVLRGSPFDINVSAARLAAFYEDCLGAVGEERRR